ncbi:MAG: hypothetical protein IPK83_21770 [Planctomycetes bacterium]|nr:hypothetical protein [Planctomycetota bacterium]
MCHVAPRLRHSTDARPHDCACRAAQPRGVFAAAIYVALTPPGRDAPADPADYRFALTASRFPATVEFNGADAGQTAHYLARWLNSRCEAGPWSRAASATVAG